MLEKFQFIALQSTKTIFLHSVLVEVMYEFASDMKALPRPNGYVLLIENFQSRKKQKGDP